MSTTQVNVLLRFGDFLTNSSSGTHHLTLNSERERLKMASDLLQILVHYT